MSLADSSRRRGFWCTAAFILAAALACVLHIGAGVVRGNYYDGLMDTTSPVFGSVDKTTQRAAWTIGETKDRVFEAGLFNLTQTEAPVLVHFGADKTQQWLLVRVERPADGK